MVRLGVIGCSDIAYRRFMPAVQFLDKIKVIAIAEEYAPEKLKQFCGEYGLEAEAGFEALLARPDIDAVYIPQPPALHYRWAKRALECGKHVLVEKPSTVSLAQSQELVDMARERGLALHENYMFQYHSQISRIQEMIQSGAVGEVRLYRAEFGFPLRQQNDFRYSRALGGGALLDAGGYPLKLASVFLGETVKVDAARMNLLPGYEVDMYGSASLSNDDGTVFQIGYGMDCSYRCCLEVWGSRGRLFTDRIFTAPEGYEPKVLVETAEGSRTVALAPDGHFRHSVEAFCAETADAAKREAMYAGILRQAGLVEDVRRLSERREDVL